ncbi:MAG: MATE family efflux transporter [Bacteroidota bacterium]|nr:MATE family efflux transporter [Bacteroidota bacterium]
MKKKSEKLGIDSIPKLLFNLSMPSIFGMLAVTLYHVADTIFIGRGVGTMGIAAVSVAMPFLMTITIFGQAIGMGGASIISRALGANDFDKANLTLNNLIHSIFVANIVVISLAFVFLEPVLIIFGGSEEYLDLAIDYTQIALIGSFFMNITSVTMNAVRAEGNARFAMIVMIIGAVLNLIVDPIFIFVFEWGMKGAALATTLSQLTGAVFAVWYFTTPRSVLNIRLKKLLLKPKLYILKESFAIGSASFVRQMASTLIVILLNHSLLKYGGPVSVATFGVIFRILMFNFMPLFGINQGFMPIVGFNYGAGNYERVRHVLRAAIRATTVFSVISFGIFFVLSSQMILLFSEDAELLNSGNRALRIIVIMLPIIGFQIVTSGLFQALGKVWPSIFLAMSRQVLFLIPFVTLLPLAFGLDGIWYSFPAADFMAGLVALYMLLKEVRRLKQSEKMIVPNIEKANMPQ